MNSELIIALDAMGGDHAPEIVVEGAKIARERYPSARYLIFGDEAKVAPLVAQYPQLADAATVHHTDQAISGEDKPAQAVRRGRDSSMGLAIQAVREGDAVVAVSAGNTGALMALSKFMLRTMHDIDRPALASIMPTLRGESVMLDLGANVECSEENLIQFAVMGAVFARSVLGLARPRVGLLNIGVEELKGNDEVKAAGRRLRDAPLPMEFAGYVEGDGIGAGDFDVVVTDGFSGNVALKTAEGTAKLIYGLVRQVSEANFLTKLGLFIGRQGLNALRDHLDPQNHNGAVFLGLNGLVVKSHGGAGASSFASAIGVAADMARHDLINAIHEDLKNFRGREELPAVASAE